MRALLFSLLFLCASAGAWEPPHTVKIVVPTGGAGTITSIAYAARNALVDAGVDGIVVARPGAEGAVAAEAIATAPRDGCTIGLFGNLYSDTHPSVFPLVKVATYQYMEVFSLNPQKGAERFVAVSAGGSFRAAVMARGRGEKVDFVSYKSAYAAFVDVAAGRVGRFYPSLLTATELLRSGKLKPGRVGWPESVYLVVPTGVSAEVRAYYTAVFSGPSTESLRAAISSAYATPVLEAINAAR